MSYDWVQVALARVWDGEISASMANLEYALERVQELTATRKEWYIPGMSKTMEIER